MHASSCAKGDRPATGAEARLSDVGCSFIRHHYGPRLIKNGLSRKKIRAAVHPPALEA